ncbi:MAG: hypothetical protein CL503_00845 [Actinobacteria bacterium]|nr:hypothetical protein [Actinomycetota bacterium]|tara:strand:+ start:547 stop:2649 length:2103 start_codon:yes stop_codon:yes gene_type:complete
MSVECPITKKEIKEAVIAPDGITYERSALLKYIRKYKKSPVTGEPMDGKTLIFGNDYLESKEEIAERVLNYIRDELDEHINLKKQSHSFEKTPEDIEIYLKINSDDTWGCYAKNKKKEEMVLPEKLLKSIQYNACAMYFYIDGSSKFYKTKLVGNGRLKIFGDNRINELCEKNGKVVISRFSSFTKEFHVQKWLREICAEEIVTAPLRVLLGLEENTQLELDTEPDTDIIEPLNNCQRSVFLKENMCKIQVIEGPPGTGKTTVITSLLRFFEKCFKGKNHYTIVVSEKNRGVDAVAEKLKDDDINEKIISFGSDNIGETTEKFLVGNKVENHKNVVKYIEVIKNLESEIDKRIRKLKRTTYNIIPRNIHKTLSVKNLGCVEDLLKSDLSNSRIRLDKIKNINNILSEISELNKQISELRKNHEQIVSDASNDYLIQCSIILVTFGSLHQVLNFLKDKDDITLTIIVDESSTMLSWQGLYLEHIANDIGGFLENMILIGDSKQLPPYWPDHNNPNQEKESFLDFSKKKCKSIQFREQYRLPNDIMKILNKQYYKELPLILGHKRITNESISWNHSFGVEEEQNMKEATNILKLVSKYPVGQHILIVSPYRSQCELLVKMFDQYYFNVSIMTLDSVQGHEAEIVVVSLVKSIPTSFLTKKRTCVLVSRAREKLIIFGNRQNCLKSSNGSLRCLARYKECLYR